MPQTTTSSDRLTEYERAVCYYTIPQVAGPVTLGIIIVYGLCLLETIAALAYGAWFGDATWLTIGAWTFGGMILFGIIVFFVRALAQDLRIRYALAVARRSPPAYTGDDIPDPFADHLLLKKPLPAAEGLYAFTDDSGHIRYYVETRQKYRYWRIQQTPDEPYCDVMVLEGVRSFTFFPRGRARPSRLGVYRENRLIAEVSSRFGWTQSEIDRKSTRLNSSHT